MNEQSRKPAIMLLGTRGIPAAHGGFETFVGYLAPYLAERGWNVSVHCQEEGEEPIWTDTYRGVTRIHIPVPGNGTKPPDFYRGHFPLTRLIISGSPTNSSRNAK